MISRDHNKVDMSEEIFKELTETLDTAAAYTFGRDKCVVNRSYMLRKVNELRACLPEGLRQAMRIVLQEKEIIQQCEQEREDTLAQARAEADKIRATAQADVGNATAEAQKIRADAENDAQEIRRNAEQQANELLYQAQEEARRIAAKARQEADQIRADAQRQLREAVAKENVLRIAQVEADEIRQQAQQQVSQLHDDVFDYLDGVMSAIDGFMYETSKRVRTEQKALNDHRLNLQNPQQ